MKPMMAANDEFEMDVRMTPNDEVELALVRSSEGFEGVLGSS